MNATFRICSQYGWIGGIGLLFFAAMAVASVLGIYFEAPPEQRSKAIVFGLAMGASWMVWVGVGAWLLLAYRRHRLTVAGGRIESIGVIRRKSLCLPEITSANWRCWGTSGRLVLRSTATRLTMELDNYEPEERRQIIRFFRESVPPPLQVGWELFYVRIVKRQFHSARRAQQTELGQGEALLTRRRMDVYFLASAILAVPIAIYVTHATGEPRSWVGVPMFLLLWLLFRYQLPRKGSVTTRLTAVPGWRSMMWVFLSGFAGMGSGAVLNSLLPEASMPFLVVFFALWFPWALAMFWRVDRDRRRKEQDTVDAERASARLVPEELLTPWTKP